MDAVLDEEQAAAEGAEHPGVDAVEDHPEDGPDPDAPPTYGVRNRYLPEQLTQALTRALTEIGDREKFDRRREVMRDRRNRYYRRGFQHIYENRTTGTYALGVAGGSVSVGNTTIECPNYIGDYNIYRPTLMIIESVLTQQPPGIDFRADNPALTEDIEAAETAEDYKEFFNRANDTKKIQLDICEMFGNSGRCVLWMHREADAQRWGLNDEGEPKQMEVASVYGTLETKVPILCRTQQDCLYTVIFDDPDVKMAKRQYPHIAKKIVPSEAGMCENDYERIARLGVLQGTRRYAQVGEALAHLITRVNAFLRPANFTGEKYDETYELFQGDEEHGIPADDPEAHTNEDGKPWTVGQKLEQLFPSGCHAVYVGKTYAESWDESLDDVIEIGFPYAGDGMSREAMMDDAVVIQDYFNDCMNAMREATDLGWPRTFIDCEEDEFDAIQEQRSEPYAFSPMKARAAMALEHSFFREPDLTLPESVVKLMEYLAGPFLQFVLGTPPALFGASMEDQKTASGYAQARAQAMGVKGIPWMSLQWMMARMYYKAALLANKNPDHSREIVVTGPGGTQRPLELAKIGKGHFGCFPDEDSSFPETTEQKRAQLTELLAMAAQAPEIGQQLADAPDNWETIKGLRGWSELVLPEAEARNKQLREIEVLLKNEPVPPSEEELEAAQVQHAQEAVQAQIAGQPAPPFDPAGLEKPYVMPQYFDFDQWELKKVEDWLSSSACARELAAGNTAGVRNVELHGKAHEARIKAKAAMMAPAAPALPAGTPPPAAAPPANVGAQ